MNICNLNNYYKINEIMWILGEVSQNTLFLPLSINTNKIFLRNFPIIKLIEVKIKFSGWGMGIHIRSSAQEEIPPNQLVMACLRLY